MSIGMLQAVLSWSDSMLHGTSKHDISQFISSGFTPHHVHCPLLTCGTCGVSISTQPKGKPAMSHSLSHLLICVFRHVRRPGDIFAIMLTPSKADDLKQNLD